MKKILSILCVFSLILGIGSINLTASADNSESTEIDFVQLRRAEKYESNGKKGVRLYKESNSQYDMFVAKTNRELENNKKYLISMDYKNNSAERIWPQITLMNTDSMEGWGDSGYLGNDLGHLYSESYSDWRRVSVTVDTTGMVDDTHKYLSFAVKGPDGVSKVDYAICNISVQEIDGDFEFAFSSSGHFGYIDDGERQYADYTCPNTFYVGINFGAKINVRPASEYMLMFDYKKRGGFNGAAQFTIDGTAVAGFSAADTSEWQTYQVRIKIPDTVASQEIRFSASTLEGACSFSFDNFRLIPLDSNNIYPSYLKDMSFYQTETNEYGWKFDTNGSSYITTGFVTDYVLEPNTKYLVTLDYKLPFSTWNKAVYFGYGNGAADGSGFNSMDGRVLSYMGWSQTNEWTGLTAVIDTGSAIDSENKYFGIWGQTVGVPDFAFKNLKIQKMSSEYIFPTYLRDMEWDAENGEIAWKFASNGTSYVVTGYTTNYELKPNSAYAVNFDYRQTGSSWNGGNALKFGAASNTTDLEGHESAASHALGSLNLGNSADWKNKTVIIKTESIADGTNKYLGVWGQTENLPDFAFKNLTVTEIENNQIMPKWENQFTYSFDSDGKIVWNLSKTAGADDYSYIGFTTDQILEKNKDYVIAFDYKYLKNGWLAWSLEPQAVGNSFSESAIKEQTDENRQTLNNRNLNTDWETRKIAFSAADVTSDNKYLAFFGKVNPGAEYDISMKNICLYTLGDVDFSGEIDTTDLAVLKKDLLGADSTVQFADVNNDGNIDIKDLVHLKKMFTK